MTVGALLVSAFIVAWYLAAISGLTRPQLSNGGGWSSDQSPAGRTLSQQLTITNEAWAVVPLAGAESPLPGLTVTGVTGLPETIGSGQTATITVHYRITDCSKLAPTPTISYGPIEQLQLTVAHWWGTFSVPIAEIPRDIAAEMCLD